MSFPQNVIVGLAKEMQDDIRMRLKRLLDSLSPDEDLIVYYFDGVERLNVKTIVFRTTTLVALDTDDASGNTTITFCHLDALKLTCKVVKRQPNQPPKNKIGFVTGDDTKLPKDTPLT
ncbi:MAG: hypothetical protein LAQ69_07165 [Acidobacteriia bacterium]|nr:hypothetical protein [Terriglobia bacterium]